MGRNVIIFLVGTNLVHFRSSPTRARPFPVAAIAKIGQVSWICFDKSAYFFVIGDWIVTQRQTLIRFNIFYLKVMLFQLLGVMCSDSRSLNMSVPSETCAYFGNRLPWPKQHVPIDLDEPCVKCIHSLHDIIEWNKVHLNNDLSVVDILFINWLLQVRQWLELSSGKAMNLF